MRTEREIKIYAGFVKDNNTGNYKNLFMTEWSAILAHNRAQEKAEEYNRYAGLSFDVNDIIVKHCTGVVKTEYSDWEDYVFNEQETEHFYNV